MVLEKVVCEIGFLMCFDIVFWVWCVIGGIVLIGYFVLEYGLVCNMVGGSYYVCWVYGVGFCVFNDVVVVIKVM